MTRILEELGMNSYSYTGDWGSSPNRAFIGRRKISDKVIAFPLVPYNRYPTLGEYYETGLTGYDAVEVNRWLRTLVDYVGDHKVVRTFQLPEHEIYYFPDCLSGFVNYLVNEQDRHKRLVVRPMSEYADFFLRFLQTEYVFSKENQNLTVSFQNPQSLNGIVLALPKPKYRKPEDDSLKITEDERYYYVQTVELDEKTKNIVIGIIN